MEHAITMQAYNLLTPEALANPYPVYERLRREDPVHWSEILQAWILTRYDDVVAVLHDPRVSADRVDEGHPAARTPAPDSERKFHEECARCLAAHRPESRGRIARPGAEHGPDGSRR